MSTKVELDPEVYEEAKIRAKIDGVPLKHYVNMVLDMYFRSEDRHKFPDKKPDTMSD